MTTDTTPEYILMCEKAVEVQEAKDRFWVIGDAIHNPIHNATLYWNGQWDVPAECFYLPDQPHLQAMVKIEDKYQRRLLHALFFAFRCFVQGDDADTWWDFREEFTSMEQLWLAFVMKETHGKQWDGTDWVANA